MGLGVTQLAVTCLALLGLGYILFFILGRLQSLAPTITQAWPLLHSETLIVGSAVGAFWIGGWVLWLAVLALTFRCMYEAACVAQRRAAIPSPALFGLGLCGAAVILSFVPFGIVCVVAPIALIVLILMAAQSSADTSKGVLLDLAIFPALPLLVFAIPAMTGTLAGLLLTAFILVETFDSYALLGGKLFGKRKAFPVLSPNKTVEGLVIGAIILMLTAAIVGKVLGDIPVLVSGAVALLAGVLTLIGDLTASRLKRRSGVKDYPAVLPIQGGLLDITDSWIVTGAGLVCLVTLAGIG